MRKHTTVDFSNGHWGVQIIIREEQQAIGGLLGSFQRILPSLPPPPSQDVEIDYVHLWRRLRQIGANMTKYWQRSAVKVKELYWTSGLQYLQGVLTPHIVPWVQIAFVYILYRGFVEFMVSRVLMSFILLGALTGSTLRSLRLRELPMVSDPPNESLNMRVIPVRKSHPCGLAPKTCSGLFDRFSSAAQSMLNQELGLWCSGVPADPVVFAVAASRSCKATDIDSRNPDGWDNLSDGGSEVCSSDADTVSDTGHTSYYVSMPPRMHQTISWEVGDTRVRNSRSFFLRPPLLSISQHVVCHPSVWRMFSNAGKEKRSKTST